jgi:hypothetical protein
MTAFRTGVKSQVSLTKDRDRRGSTNAAKATYFILDYNLFQSSNTGAMNGMADQRSVIWTMGFGHELQRRIYLHVHIMHILYNDFEPSRLPFSLLWLC